MSRQHIYLGNKRINAKKLKELKKLCAHLTENYFAKSFILTPSKNCQIENIYGCINYPFATSQHSFDSPSISVVAFFRRQNVSVWGLLDFY